MLLSFRRRGTSEYADWSEEQAMGARADLHSALFRFAASLFRLSLQIIPCYRSLNSLLPEIFSLITCVGNCARSCCSTAVSCNETGLRETKIAKFPVKFPVSREFTWRRERSTLRRQPGNVRFREFPFLDEKRP